MYIYYIYDMYMYMYSVYIILHLVKGSIGSFSKKSSEKVKGHISTPVSGICTACNYFPGG